MKILQLKIKNLTAKELMELKEGLKMISKNESSEGKLEKNIILGKRYPSEGVLNNRIFKLKNNLSIETNGDKANLRIKKKMSQKLKRKCKINYVCLFCGLSNNCFSKLSQHMRGHTGEKPYKCPDCPKWFRTNRQVKQHHRVHTGEKPYTCSSCGRGFAQRSTLKGHFSAVHSGKARINCGLCSSTFTGRKTLGYHIKKIHSGSILYSAKCPFCPKKYENAYHLGQHMRTHTGEKPYKCSICSKSFTTRTLMKAHERVHNNEKEYGCPDCPKRFKRPVALRYHAMHAHAKGPLVLYKCEVCGNEFRQKVSLDSHMNRVHSGSHGLIKKEKMHNCKFCGTGKSFWTFQELSMHMRTHTHEKPYKCSICSKSFTTSSTLARHRLVHASESSRSTHSCTICGKQFSHSQTLRQHMSDFHDDQKEPLECPLCAKKFYRKGLLNFHVKKAHLRIDIYKCTFCSKEFPAPSILEQHIRTHTGERPFKCKDCPKDFKSQSYLKLHQTTHSSDGGLVECSECGKKLSLVSLKIHKLSFHGGEGRPSFKCDECPKSFSHLNTLRSHKKKVHNPNARKPHSCSFCPMSFWAFQALDGHIRTHTGERPYKCTECSECFYTATHLSQHKRRHTGFKLNCNQCSKSFNSKSNLKDHMKRMHTPV